MDMDETLRWLSCGLSYVKQLELNLPELVNQPAALAAYCDKINGVFGYCKERLSCYTIGHSQHGAGAGGIQQFTSGVNFDGNSQLWSQNRSSVFNSGAGGSRNQARGRGEGDRVVKRVPVPINGNVDTPPEDGYLWKKYGKKEILGSSYPRTYYKCTHQKLYNCPAKKRVQRMQDDPYNLEVTYIGTHICHMDSAAVPPAPSVMNPSSSSFSLYEPHDIVSSIGSSSTVAPFPENQFPMGFSMFSCGSSSSNCMDFIFPPNF